MLSRSVVLVILLAASVPAAASTARTDPPLIQRVSALAPQVDRAAVAARTGDPDAVQVLYEIARDLEEAVHAVSPVSAACGQLRRDALALARAHVTSAEGVDLLRPDLVDLGRRRAAIAKRRLDQGSLRCRSGASTPIDATSDAGAERLLDPGSGQAVFGRARVKSRAPSGAAWAVVGVDGHGPSCTTATASERHEVGARRTLDVDLALNSGRHDIEVSFCSAGTNSPSRSVGTRRATGVWALSSSAESATAPRSPDRALSNRLRTVAGRFDGYSAVWFHDLRTGRVASWNAETRFPAASTVKLGVLIAALRVLGEGPEWGPYAYDLETMIGWSSNLATNRLLGRLGRGSPEAGARVADRVLKELGARSSTFTGEYRVGTSAARPSAAPPLVSARVTTAHDLGRLLYQIHAGALGRRAALASLRLDQRRAQLALGLLLDSEPLGDNVGLVRGSVPPSVPIAQKHGWLRDARHTAALVFQARGPELVVLLTYRSGLTLASASAYAGDVLRVVLSKARRP